MTNLVNIQDRIKLNEKVGDLRFNVQQNYLPSCLPRYFLKTHVGEPNTTIPISVHPLVIRPYDTFSTTTP